MCCGQRGHHGTGHGYHYGNCCCSGSPSHTDPRFWSEKERLEMLEQTLKGLREEAKHIEHLIGELEKGK